jgi:hypothetical protein
MTLLAKYITEPLLDFGENNRHVDIKTGIRLYGPYDYDHAKGHKVIRTGIIGTNQSIEGVSDWFERCKSKILTKESSLKNIYQDFPGFNSREAFHAEILVEDAWKRVLTARKLSTIETLPYNDHIDRIVEIIVEEAKTLTSNHSVNVIICALPQELIDNLASKKKEERFPLNLRSCLKARLLFLGKPTQIILPYTYDSSYRKHRKQIQDDATIAWNLHTAIYYKAGGTPWRLNILRGDIKTCFIGVSFYRDLHDSNLNTSMAQVFNQRGEGVIVRGASVRLSRKLRSPHLNSESSLDLLKSALEIYKSEHFHLPARVVIHKSSEFYNEELAGFNGACDELGVQIRDFISLSNSKVRLLRHGDYPVLRGSALKLSRDTFTLYTNGSIPYFRTYPGLYIPQPIQIKLAQADFTWEEISSEMLSLSKMNWNNTQFSNREPITLEASRSVGGVLKYLDKDDYISPQYRFYM